MFVHLNFLVMFAFTAIVECDCFFDGTDGIRVCNATNGKCICAEGISGTRCTQCEGTAHFIIENGTCNGMYLPLYFPLYLLFIIVI